jgi:hypothetical protein
MLAGFVFALVVAYAWFVWRLGRAGWGSRGDRGGPVLRVVPGTGRARRSPIVTAGRHRVPTASRMHALERLRNR